VAVGEISAAAIGLATPLNASVGRHSRECLINW